MPTSIADKPREGGKRVLVIIPARGGSKGLAKKNVQRVGGRPLIVRTVECACSATRVSRVVVSTDDDEIAALAQHAGAEIVRRPAELSGDAASSEDALLHVLEVLRETERYQPDVVVFMQCTSPLTAAADVDGTIALLSAQPADCAFTVTPSHATLWREETGGWTSVNRDAVNRPPRQHRAPEYQETGAVYAMNTTGFLAARSRFFGRVAAYVTPRARAIEIDDHLDLDIANAVALNGSP